MDRITPSATYSKAPHEVFEIIIRMLADLVLQECAARQTSKAKSGPAFSTETMNDPRTKRRRLLTIGELSEYVSIPKSSIYTMVCLRKIPAKAIVRLGRALRFDFEEINSWIEENRSKN